MTDSIAGGLGSWRPPRLHAVLISLVTLVIGAGPAVAREPYVLVSTDSSIWKFDLDGKSLGRLVEPGATGLAAPQHVAVGSDGHLYVANFFGGLEVYNLDTGDHVRSISTGDELLRPTYLTIRDDVLIVSTFGTSRILQYDLNDSDRLMDDLIPGNSPNFKDPHGITWLDNGDMIVSMQFEVSRYNAAGEYLGTFTNQNVSRPTGSLVLGDDLIVNNFNGNTQRYDLGTGAYLGEFNLDSRGDGGDGTMLMPDGSVLLASNVSLFVRRYDADGNFLNFFAGKSEIMSEGPNGMLLVPAAPTAGLIGLGTMFATRRRR